MNPQNTVGYIDVGDGCWRQNVLVTTSTNATLPEVNLLKIKIVACSFLMIQYISVVAFLVTISLVVRKFTLNIDELISNMNGSE